MRRLRLWPWRWRRRLSKAVCVGVVVILASVLLICGVNGLLEPLNAASTTRRVVLSVTTGILDPSELQAPYSSPPPSILEDGAAVPSSPTRQSDAYAPSPVTSSEGNEPHPPTELPPAAVITTMQPSAPPGYFDQTPTEAIPPPAIGSPRPSTASHAGYDHPPSYMIPPSPRNREVPDPALHGKPQSPNSSGRIPFANSSSPPPAKPPTALLNISVSSPNIVPTASQSKSSQSPLTAQFPPAISASSPPTALAAPHSGNYWLSPPKSIPPPASLNKNGIPVAAPPDKLSSQNNSPPQESVSSPPIDGNRHEIPAAPPSTKSTLKPPAQQVQNSHFNAPAISPSSIASPTSDGPKFGMPVPAPPKESSKNLSPANDVGGSVLSPASTNPPGNHGKTHDAVAPGLAKEKTNHLPPIDHSHVKSTALSPASTSPPVKHSKTDVIPGIAPSTSPPVNHSLSVDNAQAVGNASSPSSNTSPVNHRKAHGTPVAAPSKGVPNHSLPGNDTRVKRNASSPSSNASPVNQRKAHGTPVAAPSKGVLANHSLPGNDTRVKRHTLLPTPRMSPGKHGKTNPTSVASPSEGTPNHLTSVNHSEAKSPAAPPTGNPTSNGSTHKIPIAAPPKEKSHQTSPKKRSHRKGFFPAKSPAPQEAENSSNTRHAPPIAAPPKEISHHSSPRKRSHRKGFFPAISPAPQEAENSSNARHAPASSHPKDPSRRQPHSPAPAPVASLPAQEGKIIPSHAPHHSYHLPSHPRVPSHAPAVVPKHGHKHIAPSPYVQGPSISQAPSNSESSSPSPSPVVSPSIKHKRHGLPTAHPPNAFNKHEAPSPQPFQVLPPPPPNLYCTPLSCPDPFTNSPPGTPCLCVLPIKVELRLSIALYSFFTLVSELAQEIASGVFMKQSQVRIMGANADNEDLEKTIVLIDLVPLGEKFDNTTTFLVFEKFWHKQVSINPKFFGEYDVLSVLYPGLPPSPPTAAGNANSNLNNEGNGGLHPLAVNIPKKKDKQNGGIMAVIVLSSVFAFALSVGAALVIYLKLRDRNHLQAVSSTLTKTTGPGSMATRSRLGSRPTSPSASFTSNMVTCKGTAKIFSLLEIERATCSFDDSRIIGEGGFGRVYEGILEDGTRVALKVLKRRDQQGGREFLAEAEMLSRLHHRNLVKLIGICTEQHVRCLVYELVPNGSVESHLHESGSDKEIAPLDWDARLKIALGSARALAYLHEDSNPRVIHRDFKSSNILLEHDFTPKVSDFGLARAALGEGNVQISTRVMGTFGYIAPEYAMTGHLLVKSDVYSYGVVLLELLTGRKPIDMSRPPGQENLVTWARPLLTSRDGLEAIIDPSLGNDIPFDSLAKVAAIASMCVQPEVDQRPFMGEVVQALKLVCNEGNEFRESGSCSQELNAVDAEARTSTSLDMEVDKALSASDLFSASGRFAGDTSGSFRRYTSSGPLRRERGGQLWERLRSLSTGSSRRT